jgi:EmrB/QacA subfamily drug resistance transporter
MIDQTILPLALPTIQRELALSNVGLQWLVNAYMLAVAAVILGSGRLADLAGRRKIFCAGLTLFTCASLLGGCAPSSPFGGFFLISCRAAQGVGAALISPAAIALLVDIFPPGQRGKVIGLFVASGALFLSLGPIIGGFLTSYLSWRWIFWMNGPLGLFALALTVSVIRPSEPMEPFWWEKFSWSSYGLLAGFIVCAVIAMMQASIWGWLSRPSLILIMLCGLFFTLFYRIDRRRELRAIDFSLLRYRLFAAGCLITCMLQFVIMVTVFWGLYFQNILRYTPMEAGWITSISALALVIMPVVAGYISDRYGPRLPVCLGLGSLSFAFIWFALHTLVITYEPLIPALIAFGLGIGLVNTPISSATLSTVPPAKRGVASGMTGSVRWLGGALGVALLGGVLNRIEFHTFESLLKSNPMTAKLKPHLFEGLFSRKHSATEALNQLKAGTASWVEGSLQGAFQKAFCAMNIAAAALTLVTLLITFFWLRIQKKKED